jgi:TatD DNase family protein
VSPPPPAPEPLPTPVLDNHTHLDIGRDGAAPPDVATAIAAAAAVNVTRLLQIGCELDSARWTVQQLQRHPQLLGGVALHPTEAARIVAAEGNAGLSRALAQIEGLAGHERVRVVGETGLDHYWVQDAAGREAQQVSFRAHVEIAKRLDKVLQIHDRDAHVDVVRVLHEVGAPRRTVFHCFSGDAVMAAHCAEQGWYLSFAGTLTFKNAAPLREAVRAVPIEQVLVETDAPFLTAVPYRGKGNASYLLPHTVRCLAEVLGRSLDDVCATLWATSQRVYGPL